VADRISGEIALNVVTGVPHERMPAYMNAADALLLTSAHEGSPNAVKEALACNLPVVSTPVGDVPERLAGVRPSATAATDEGLVASDHDRSVKSSDPPQRRLRGPSGRSEAPACVTRWPAVATPRPGSATGRKLNLLKRGLHARDGVAALINPLRSFVSLKNCFGTEFHAVIDFIP